MAFAGTPHELEGIGIVRVVPAAMYGDPNVLLAGKVPPAVGARVSMIRHGATMRNWRAGDAMTKGRPFETGPVEFATVICPVP